MRRQIDQPAVKVDDARKLKPKDQYEKRKQVIELHAQGISQKQTSLDTGMSESSVARIIKLYRSGGVAALEPHRRGRRSQRVPKAELAQTIQQFICAAFGDKLQRKI